MCSLRGHGLPGEELRYRSARRTGSGWRRCWSGNSEAQQSKEAEEGHRPEGPHKERHLLARTSLYCSTSSIGLQPVVEKMNRKRQALATCPGHDAGVGQSKRKG
jgi:hypothetical protein